MNPQQRYLFDLTGFLHLPAVLTTGQLEKARAAAALYFRTPAEKLPAHMGLEIDGRRYTNSFAFHRDLEALATLPGTRDVIEELTYGKPRLVMGTLMRVKHDDNRDAHCLHCAGDERGRDKIWLRYEDGRLCSNNFAVFVYLTDVFSRRRRPAARSRIPQEQLRPRGRLLRNDFLRDRRGVDATPDQRHPRGPGTWWSCPKP